MKKRPEILAPCGNMASLKAAIAAGADACYLAGNSFGARAYADNFSPDELIEAIEYAHLYGVKVYLTCNTLIKNTELSSVYAMLLPLYEAGLDAVLVQDFGVLRLLRNAFPDMEIHTSTQMNILTPAGAQLAKDMGATRVVAAREMSIKELANIKANVDIELEAFVHGAMCLCYSGRCLMSSMAGGRSGNRGRCAQPCRQKYNGEYLLSMRDLCSLQFIPELTDAGVDSLKIEGRMKNEYYTAATVEAYRNLAESYINGSFTAEKVDYYEKRLLDIFNRGGFSSGYMVRSRDEDEWDEVLIDKSMPGRRGVKVGSISRIMDGQVGFKVETDLGIGDELMIDAQSPISITSNKEAMAGEMVSLNAPETRKISKGTNIYRTRSKALTEDIEALINRDNRLPINGKVEAICGDDLSVTFERNGFSSTVYGGKVEPASKRPIDEETIRNKVSQLGNTSFYIDNLSIDCDGKGFVRIGDISELRRQAAEELELKIRKSRSRIIQDTRSYEAINKEISPKKGFEGQSNNYYYSFSYPYQVEAFLNNIPNEIIGISGYIFIILDLGLGGFTKEELEILKSSVAEVMSNFAPEAYRIELGLPYINRGEYDIQEDYGDFIESISGLYIRSIDDLAAVRNSFAGYGRNKGFEDKDILLSSSIYLYNDVSVAEIVDILSGHKGMVLYEKSLELSERELKAMNYDNESFTLYYGKLPLMVTSGLRDTTGTLTDDKGHRVSVIKCGGLCYNVILSGLSQSLHGVSRAGLCSFTNESAEEIRDILSENPRFIDKKLFTRGHFEKGI